MSDNETQADIINEIRSGDTHGSNRIYTTVRYNPQTGHSDIEGVTLDELADRIEAATAEKSIAQEKPKIEQPGNAAAMREALLSVRKPIAYHGGDLARYTLPVIDAALKTPPEPVGNAAMMRMALEVLWNVIGQFSNNILDGQMQLVLSDMLIPAKNAYHHALAAPPRNCDKYATAAEAHIAFQRFCRDNYRQGLAAAGLDGCDDCELCETKNMSGEDSCPFFWLFGTEGGAE